MANSNFYVSTSGSGTTGSLASPVSMATALSGGTTGAGAGDTYWIRGGTYVGTFSSSVSYSFTINTGTSTAPVTFRAYRANPRADSYERVILDGSGITAASSCILFDSVGTNHVWFRDIEFTDTRTVHATRVSSFCSVLRASGNMTGIKFINCIAHDMSWSAFVPGGTQSLGLEFYGTVMYYNGSGSGQEHAIYDGEDSTFDPNYIYGKVYENCISFNSIGGYGLHLYADTVDHTQRNKTIKNYITLEGPPLVGVDSGGTGTVGSNVTLDTVLTYYSTAKTSGTAGFYAGYNTGIADMVIKNCYAVGGGRFEFNGVSNRGLKLTNSTFQYSAISTSGGPTVDATNYPGNTFGTVRPTSNTHYVFPNKYEYGRGHVMIYNWTSGATYTVPGSALTSFIRPGDKYEAYWAPLYAPKTVAVSGTFDPAAGIVFPMNTLGSMPAGFDTTAVPAQASSAPEAAAFVVHTVQRMG